MNAVHSRWIAGCGCLLLVLLSLGCASARQPVEDIPDGVIARVGDETVTGQELEAFLAEVQTRYEAKHLPYPEPGTPEQSNLLAEAIDALVGRLQTERSAAELGVTVTNEEVEAQLTDLARSNGDIDEKLAKEGLSADRVRADIRAKILRVKIFEAVIAGARPTESDMRAYYDSHIEDYTRWPPREVDYLFVRDRQLADELAARLQAGEDVEALAKEHPDAGTTQGRITIEDTGPGLLPFQRAAYTLPVGEIAITHSGVGWSIVRPASPLELGQVIPYGDVADDLRLELKQAARKQAMDAWTKSSSTTAESLTTYEAGWSPDELRQEASFPLPPEPQRQECDLPDGEYTYERLVELGCGRIFPIPGLDGPPCPVALVDDYLVGGFDSDEIKSGYADYVTDDDGPGCVSDPRGQTIGIYHRPAPPLPASSSSD